eukprot:2564165-Pyramimonas_sp.AAC.1
MSRKLDAQPPRQRQIQPRLSGGPGRGTSEPDANVATWTSPGAQSGSNNVISSAGQPGGRATAA